MRDIGDLPEGDAHGEVVRVPGIWMRPTGYQVLAASHMVADEPAVDVVAVVFRGHVKAPGVEAEWTVLVPPNEVPDLVELLTRAVLHVPAPEHEEV